MPLAWERWGEGMAHGTCLSFCCSRRRSPALENTMSWPAEMAKINSTPCSWAASMRDRIRAGDRAQGVCESWETRGGVGQGVEGDEGWREIRDGERQGMEQDQGWKGTRNGRGQGIEGNKGWRGSRDGAGQGMEGNKRWSRIKGWRGTRDGGDQGRDKGRNKGENKG